MTKLIPPNFISNSDSLSTDLYILLLVYWCYNPGGSWLPPWFHNSKFFRGSVVSSTPTSRTRDSTSSGPYHLTRLVWLALPEAYAPASIYLQVTGVLRPPLHGKAIFHKEICTLLSLWIANYISVLKTVRHNYQMQMEEHISWPRMR
jgi:hypothetical protein